VKSIFNDQKNLKKQITEELSGSSNHLM